MNGEAALTLAESLLALGLPRTAASLLRALPQHGVAINRLRARAEQAGRHQPACPRLYALGVAGSVGLAFPVRAERGPPRSLGEAQALASAQALFAPARLPALTAVLPDALQLEGASAGLAVALAFVARYSGRAPSLPVFATAALDGDGRLQPVSQLTAKLTAAAAELQGEPGLVLLHPQDAARASAELPVRGVETLSEAVAALWPGPLPLDPTVLSFEALLAEAHASSTPTVALALLRGFDPAGLPEADRARYGVELGLALRHVGETAAASALHRQALQQLDAVGEVLGPVVRERIELEAWATMVDQFLVAELEPLLRERLARPFAQAHGRVRCRGLLAQVLSMAGDYGEAIALRRENLDEQQRSEEMRAELPRTLCHLLRDLARANDAAGFEGTAERLLALARLRGEGQQSRYDAWALIGGLVRLGRSVEALAWTRGQARLWQAAAPRAWAALLEGEAPIVEHPEVSTARALVRALRRAGDAVGAERLARRVATTGPGLVAWLAQLAQVEAALGDEVRREAVAGGALPRAGAALQRLYPPAASFHRRLIAMLVASERQADAEAIECELDAVYY